MVFAQRPGLSKSSWTIGRIFPAASSSNELQSTLILSLAKDVIRFQRTAMIEKPFTVDGFSGWMRDEMDEANLPLDRRIFDGYST
ncbi:hypothetical protein [Bradyrhizobium sp. BR 1433]|uniref:hypothetical protein n=1 Tax=Bradyrhizobium sp. BR 1433 TaxID=3447967 RepID=UPI003EE6BFE0